jgi:hypothetical protein
MIYSIKTKRGFTTNVYWSYIESPTNPSFAYRTAIQNGVIATDIKDGSYPRGVRCIY